MQAAPLSSMRPSPGAFPFGLSKESEARAIRVHRAAIVFDMLSMYAGGNIFAHYPEGLRTAFRSETAQSPTDATRIVDTIFWPFEAAYDGRSDLLHQWFIASGLTCGAFDIDVPDYDGGDPLACGWNDRLARYVEMPWLRVALCARDIIDAKRDGAIAVYPFYQPVIPLLRDLEPIERAHRQGLRSLMLTYNRMDHVGVGCTERLDAGLSLFGIEVIQKCNSIGLMVDVSHCGHLTTLDACRNSRKPVNANHTAARSVYDHPRGKSDEALKAIAATGGVIGIVAVPYFLSPDPAATIEAMLDHIDYVAQLVGWEHVAIGSDWPMQMPDDVIKATMGSPGYTAAVGWGDQYRRDVTQRLVGFDDCRDLINVTRGLVSRGYSDEQVTAILGGNALRVFADVCG